VRIAVSNIAWEPSDDLKITERLLAAGVNAVEVAPTKVWPDLSRVSLASGRAYGAQWERAGLPVVSAQSLLYGRPDLNLFDETRGQLVDYLNTVTDLCVAMGATALVFGSPRNRQRGDMPFDAAHRIAVDVFGQLAEHAAASGACICLEANPQQYDADYLTRASDAAALVHAVDAPGLRLHLDTACMALAGDDGPACVTEFAPLLRHVHLSEPFLGPVGTPDQEHIAIADALHSAGYQHYVSVEMRPSAERPVAAVERAARYAVKIFGDQA
jgi:sugar phosphate isomerase/epimerase